MKLFIMQSLVMGEVVSIFRDAGFNISAKIANPTERTFLESVGISEDQNPITSHYLKNIYQKHYGAPDIHPHKKLRWFNENRDWITHRIHDIRRRFQESFEQTECPDHILAIALDIISHTEVKYYTRMTNVGNDMRDNMLEISENVCDLTHDACPTQGDYGLLSPCEKFLAGEYVCDLAQTLINEKPARHGQSYAHTLTAYKTRVTHFMVFADIDFGHTALAKEFKTNLSELKGYINQINSTIEQQHYPTI